MNETGPVAQLDALLDATPRKIWRRWASLGLLAIVAIIAAILLFRFFDGEESPYLAVPIVRGDLKPRLLETSTLQAGNEIVVSAGVPGRVTRIAAAAAGWVDRDQILAMIDSNEVQQALIADRAELQAAQADLERSKTTVSETASRLARFEDVWRRSSGRVPSLGELEAARADTRRAEAERKMASARLRGARRRLAANTERLRLAAVKAPVAGFVEDHHVRPGQHVDVGTPLFTVATETKRMRIEIPLNAVAARVITPGTKAQVLLDQEPKRTITGRVTEVSADNRATIVIANPRRRLRPGMKASVEIALPPRRNVLLVRSSALAFDPASRKSADRGRIFLLADDGSARAVPVVVGAGDGERTEVFGDGLEPGALAIVGWRDPPKDADSTSQEQQ